MVMVSAGTLLRIDFLERFNPIKNQTQILYTKYSYLNSFSKVMSENHRSPGVFDTQCMSPIRTKFYWRAHA